MRINHDHATIALVTLDDRENANEDRGRLLRALARVHSSTEASHLELGGKPGLRAQIQIQPAGRIATANAMAGRATQPQATPCASTTPRELCNLPSYLHIGRTH